jgi:N-acetyl-gamma-glutamyl-phosphate reductase
MTPPTRVAVIGATGYAGATAATLLWRHPCVQLRVLTSRSYAGRNFREVVPGDGPDLVLQDGPDPGDAEVVVVALPHGMAASLAGSWVKEGRTVIDLGADFRLRDAVEYRRWYGAEHASPGLLGSAVFGLPELGGEQLGGATLVACPGCYSTAAIISLFPAARAGLGSRDYIVDAASGVSGAGRSLALGSHFAEVAEDYRAYAVDGHRHLPEIVQALGEPAARITFVPHLVPMVRGILATTYFNLEGRHIEEVRAIYAAAYEGLTFVRLASSPPHTKEVAGTNMCLVHVAAQGDRAVVVTALDNLLKGASGQAVQALNLVMGWPEATGLEGLARWP